MVLEISASDEGLPPVDVVKVQHVIEYLARAIDALRPDFAFVDHYFMNVSGRIGVDLRTCAWGVTVYGPDLVRKIGKDRLLTAPAYRVEEFPWGGIWLQPEENPFLASGESKRRVEEHLGLNERLGESDQFVQKPALRRR